MKTITTLTLGVLLLASGLSFAQSAPQTAKSVEVGNKLCPVSGEKVGTMGKGVQYKYNGKIYNLCCPMCKKDFKNNPDKFSKIAEEEVAAEKR